MAPEDTRLGSTSERLNDYLSERAQRQLDALRAALDDRLAALEAVLTDPTRGESLEGLILDLARVATEEAQAAASKACVDTKQEADAEIAQTVAASQAAIERERAVISDLRRAVEQAQHRISSLESQRQTELRTAAEALESQIARGRVTAADLEHAAAEARRQVAETQRQLEKERGVVHELRQAAERAGQLSTTLAREKAEALAASQKVASELSRERESAASLERALHEAQSQLEKERGVVRQLREAAERAGELSTTVAREKAEALAASQEVTTELSRERESMGSLQRALHEAQSQLEAERGLCTTLRQIAGHAELELAGAIRDKAQALVSHEEVQRELASARAEAEVVRVDFDQARTRLEALDAERLRAEQAWKETAAQLDSVTRERDTLAAELQTATERIELPDHGGTTGPAPSVEALAPKERAHPVDTGQRVGGPTPTDDDGWVPIRLVDRYAFREPIAVQINGESGLLYDLSISGCQLVSSAAVKPNQVIKVVLPSVPTSIAFTGKIMWARLEPPVINKLFGYRAGVQFTKPDQSAIEAFVASHSATA